MPEADFIIDERLRAGSVLLGEMPLSSAFLKDDSRFGWVVLVPRRADLRELVDLGDADMAMLVAEIRAVSAALQVVLAPDKLNVAAIGNIVEQLHVHVVARNRDDAAWPGTVWSAGPATPHAQGECERLATALRVTLGLMEPHP